ncbi:MAG: hypothetical protein AB7S38_28930 [Vulcanimicrobiota bacterium]
MSEFGEVFVNGVLIGGLAGPVELCYNHQEPWESSELPSEPVIVMPSGPIRESIEFELEVLLDERSCFALQTWFAHLLPPMLRLSVEPAILWMCRTRVRFN